VWLLLLEDDTEALYESVRDEEIVPDTDLDAELLNSVTLKLADAVKDSDAVLETVLDFDIEPE
jgi:hypothetical protein